MRSFEDEARGETSEDDHPSTDASEDSVEVQVAPIVRPNSARAEGVRRLPRKFRKAFEKETSPAAPLDFSATSLAGSPKHASKGASASPLPLLRAASPPRAKVSRRKPSEPRRVVEQETPGTKRPIEEEWIPRKAARGDGLPSTPGKVQGQPLPQHEMLGHNPFMGPFVPPHLLLPPSWPHVARYPYAHLVGGMLGPPIGFLSSAPYPLLPILPPRAPPPSSPKLSPSDPPPSSESEKRVRLNGLGAVVQYPRPPSAPSPNSAAGTSPTRRAPSKQTTSHKKFLSVESLLSVSSPESKPGDVGTGVSSTQPRDSCLQEEDSDAAPAPSPSSSGEGGSIQALLQRPAAKQKQRNYKNMTRERRIEANARERTRVHTISAAFETLRRAVPSFSHNQKLSKLSVLRIASSYILALSRLAGHDYSRGGTSPTFQECVDLTTKTIQVEGKTKKKRED